MTTKSNESLDLYLLQDGTHAESGACAVDPAGVLRHTESKLAVCTYEDGTPQTVGQDAINNKNVAAANAGELMPPLVAAIEPASCTIGSPDFTLVVNGTGFTAASVIHFADHDEPTTFSEADGSLSTGVKPSLWAAPVVVKCSVRNGAAESNRVDFEFLAQGARRSVAASPPTRPLDASAPKAAAEPAKPARTKAEN